MRTIWSPLAVERASEAADYIARDNPAASERWFLGLVEAVEGLSKFPEQGRIVPEVRRPDIREILYASYRIVYRVESSRVIILTVRHGRRLLDKAELFTGSE